MSRTTIPRNKLGEVDIFKQAFQELLIYIGAIKIQRSPVNYLHKCSDGLCLKPLIIMLQDMRVVPWELNPPSTNCMRHVPPYYQGFLTPLLLDYRRVK